MPGDELRRMIDALSGDQRRKEIGFSEDMRASSDILLSVHSTDEERCLAIKAWIYKNQPCLFGKIAAKDNRIFYSIIDDKLLARGGDAVSDKIKRDKKKWKNWATTRSFFHSFLLVVASRNVYDAAPNRAMQQLASWFEEKAGSETVEDAEGNRITSEWLYLKNPAANKYYKFRVNLDFFASAGDKRCWHDHRFPGGFGFTLNSVGHMARYREWYGLNTDQVAWAVKTAMSTINSASSHPEFGPATQLIELRRGGPLKKVRCPFASLESIPTALRNKDWSVYAGAYHTDHAVRDEFFNGTETPPTLQGLHNLDFSYIIDAEQGENAELMNGVEVTEEEFLQEAGRPGDQRRFDPEEEFTPEPDMATFRDGDQVPPEERAKIEAALAECRQWLETPLSETA